MSAAPLVSIIIPTVRRPGPFGCAAASALAQDVTGVAVELVIVDNDPLASARAQVAALSARATFPVRYIHAPLPGVANARNAGVSASTGAFIAFLDDDEIAPEGWLKALLVQQRQFDADAVFGPVRTRLPDGTLAWPEYFAMFFARSGPEEACAILDGPGCGCSLVRRDALPHPTAPFAAERNGIGGEDDLLFSTMKQAGARFAWAPDAWVWEVPEPSRLTLRYTLRRAFAYGQGPCSTAATRGAMRWPVIPLWMGVGALQMLLYGGRAVVDWLTASPDLPFTLGRVAQGLGKIFWFAPFKIRFYGEAALKRADRPHGDRHERHPDLDRVADGGLQPRDPKLPAHAG